MYCQKNYHILKKPKKKQKFLRCELCNKEVKDPRDQNEICGMGGDKCKTCPKHKEFLCEYPSQKYTHKCYCLLCNSHTAELASYFFRIKPMIDLAKSDLRSREAYLKFKIEF